MRFTCKPLRLLQVNHVRWRVKFVGKGRPLMSLPYILAVDGGGTKTDIVACDLQGKVLERKVLGPSTLQNVGKAGCEALLREGWQAVTAGAGLDVQRLVGACLGVAGLDTPTDRREFKEIVRTIFGTQASRVCLESDCYIAIHCGTLGRPGIALIAGTGSMAIGENARGEQARSGGWGYLFGDEGSAYDMGRQALVAALKVADGRGPHTLLSELLTQVFGTDLETVVAELYRSDELIRAVATLAQLVDHAAASGDQVAGAIVENAAAELSAAATAVQTRLQLQERPLPIVLSGGAMNSELLRRLLHERLTGSLGDVECIRPDLPPVAGACIVALKRADVPITEDLIDALKSSLTSSDRDEAPPS